MTGARKVSEGKSQTDRRWRRLEIKLNLILKKQGLRLWIGLSSFGRGSDAGACEDGSEN